MLNLLIAVMGDSFGRVKQREACAARHEQAGMIVAKEKLLIGLNLWNPTNDMLFPRCETYLLRTFKVPANMLSFSLCSDHAMAAQCVLRAVSFPWRSYSDMVIAQEVETKFTESMDSITDQVSKRIASEMKKLEAKLTRPIKQLEGQMENVITLISALKQHDDHEKKEATTQRVGALQHASVEMQAGLCVTP
jgi:hypothetical protein